jgi:hypothetical protein
MKQHRQRWVLLISLIILVVPYLFISLYANPAGDDFTYAFKGKTNGLLESLIGEYLNWNGRYTSNLLVLINPIAFGSFAIYKLVPVLMILLTALSYLFMIRVVAGKLVSWVESFIFSLLLTMLFIYQMPIISEGIYWYTGAVSYQSGNILAMIYIGLIILLGKGTYIFRSKILHLALLSLILILTIGCNEVIMIEMLAFSLILAFIGRKIKAAHRKSAIFLLILAALCSAMVFFAPGNSTREGYFNGNHQFFHSLGFSLLQTARFLFSWISSLPLLLLSVMYFYLHKKLSKNIRLFSESFYLTPFWSTLFLFLVIFLAVFPAYWETTILGQHRTLNVAWFLFIPLWFVNLTVWFNYAGTSLSNIPPMARKFAVAVFVMILGSFLFTKNGFNVGEDLFYGKARSFDRQMNDRYALMHITSDTIYLKPIADPPKTIFIYDITDDPGHWLNQCYGVYFCQGKKVVALGK